MEAWNISPEADGANDENDENPNNTPTNNQTNNDVNSDDSTHKEDHFRPDMSPEVSSENGIALGSLASSLRTSTSTTMCAQSQVTDRNSSQPEIVIVGSKWHEIGFLASVIQLFGSLTYWISTIAGLA